MPKKSEQASPMCGLCNKEEWILKANQTKIGERCYYKLIDAGAIWGPTTTKTELLQMMRKRR